jgi:acyl carrier protein
MKKKNIIGDPDAFAEVQAKVNLIILKELHHLNATQLTPEAKIVQDLGADSLDCQMIGFQLEESFDIEMSEDDLTRLVALTDIYRLIAEKIEEE